MGDLQVLTQNKCCCLIANENFNMMSKIHSFLDFEVRSLSIQGYCHFIMIYNKYFDIEVLKILNQIKGELDFEFSIELVIINLHPLVKMSERNSKKFEAAKALCEEIRIISYNHSSQNIPLLCEYLVSKTDLLFYVGNRHLLRYGHTEGRILKAFKKHELEILLADPSYDFENPN